MSRLQLSAHVGFSLSVSFCEGETQSHLQQRGSAGPASQRMSRNHAEGSHPALLTIGVHGEVQQNGLVVEAWGRVGVVRKQSEEKLHGMKRDILCV